MAIPEQVVQASGAVLLLGVALSCGAADTPPRPGADGGPVAIYMSPSGDDSRSGRSPAEAVKSLRRVQDMLKAGDVKPQGQGISVKLLPGVYAQQGLAWEHVLPGQQIVIEPAQQPARPGDFNVVIDGSKDPFGQFLVLRVAEAGRTVETGIVVRGLHITNYCEGISLGDWKSKGKITGNVIENNRFTRIGSRYEVPSVNQGGKQLPEGACVAGVRIQNADRNLIRGNVFEKIENLPSSQTAARKYGPALLHAIYLSSGSSGNRIENNQFREFTGSPIRIRASSNDTVVSGNSFANPIYVGDTARRYRMSAVTQWYCNDAVKVCLDKAEDGHQECPSTGIEIARNRVGSGLDLYADDSQSKRATCPATGQLSAGQRAPRLIENVVDR